MSDPSVLTPVQSTRPTLREWMLTRLFSDRGLAAEFYNRLMNLCNYDYPMSPNLRGVVQSTFGFDMLGTIEQFSDREKPVLTKGLRESIRRVIPDEFYLEFIRLFDCTCCPLIIQEVADIADAVPGTEVGQLTVERYIDGSDNQHMHLYEWIGVSWVIVIDRSAKAVDGTFTDYTVDGAEAGWELSVDGVNWTTSTINFDPPVASFSVWFRNKANWCVYSGGDLSFPLQNACFQGVLVYPDFASIPAGGTVGEPAMVADNTSNPPFLFRSIYEWDGAVWNLMVELQFLDAPTFTQAFINYQDAGWEFQLNDGTWDDPNFAETNLVAVKFRQISSQCTYENDNVVPS